MKSRSLHRTGTCVFCRKSFEKAVLKRHCKHCESNDLKPSQGKEVFYLLVEGRGMPEYFLYLCVNPEGTLYDLDCFLRRIWLECCGHLSCFHIGGQSYTESPDDEFGDENMEGAFLEVCPPGSQFTYEYDFGSTTELKLKVLSSGRAALGKEPVRLLARNDALIFPCSQCGKPSTDMCSACSWEGSGSLCEKCGPKHECGEDMLLPSVNSPRSGVCAYTG